MGWWLEHYYQPCTNLFLISVNNGRYSCLRRFDKRFTERYQPVRQISQDDRSSTTHSWVTKDKRIPCKASMYRILIIKLSEHWTSLLPFVYNSSTSTCKSNILHLTFCYMYMYIYIIYIIIKYNRYLVITCCY